MVEDSPFGLIGLVYGLAYVVGIGVAIAFLYVALVKVRPRNPAAGGLMATGIVVSLALRVIQPIAAYFVAGTSSAEGMAHTMGILNAGSMLVGAAGAAMVVASVSMLVDEPGPRG